MRGIAGVTVPMLEDARPAVRVLARLAFAALLAAAGLAAVAALEPVLSRPYYFPGFAAIIVPAVLAGARYGIASAFLFGAGYAYWFLDPRGEIGMAHPHELRALVGYTLTGCFVAAVGGALRSAYAQARREHALLEKTVAQREDLLRAVMHDVRSPLGVIEMSAELLARKARAGESDPADVLRRAAVVKSGVASIDSMLRDLVKVVQLESGQVVLEPAPVDLHLLLRQVKEGLAASLPTDRVVVSLPGDLAPLRADPRRFERVLVNLISNALKYSPGSVRVSAAARGREVVVSVRDEGPGIGADDLPHVFEKYFRGRSSGEKAGLGLGLYISRLLVEAHGGRIWVESTAGEGSAFHVAMPALPPGRVEAAPAWKPDVS